MDLETFKTDVIVFIDDIIVFDVTLTDIFQYRIQLSNTDNITGRYQDKNVQITNQIYITGKYQEKNVQITNQIYC